MIHELYINKATFKNTNNEIPVYTKKAKIKKPVKNKC